MKVWSRLTRSSSSTEVNHSQDRQRSALHVSILILVEILRQNSHNHNPAAEVEEVEIRYPGTVSLNIPLFGCLSPSGKFKLEKEQP